MYAISGETWLLSSDAGFVDSDKKCFFLEETSWDHDVSAGLQRFLQHDYAPHFMQVPSGHSAKLLQLPLLCIPALSLSYSIINSLNLGSSTPHHRQQRS